VEAEPEGPGRQHRLAVLDQQLAGLAARRRSARIVRTPPPPHDVVRFGATVSLRDAEGQTQRYRIVGVDEADAASGLIAFTSPLARAVIGRRVGEAVCFQSGRGEEALEIVSMAYDAG
jgi:transcription elongation factor GreB